MSQPTVDYERLLDKGSVDESRTCVIVASDMNCKSCSGDCIANFLQTALVADGYEVSKNMVIEMRKTTGWISRRSCNAGCISDLHVKNLTPAQNNRAGWNVEMTSARRAFDFQM